MNVVVIRNHASAIRGCLHTPPFAITTSFSPKEGRWEYTSTEHFATALANFWIGRVGREGVDMAG